MAFVEVVRNLLVMAMFAAAVCFKIRGDSVKRWGRRLLNLSAIENFDPTRFVETGRLKARILDGNRDGAQFHPNTEMMPLLRTFPNGNQKFPACVTALSLNSKNISQVAMIPFVKRSRKTDAGLNRF